MPPTPTPDGIADRHLRSPRSHGRRASPASLILAAAIVGAAVLGVFGGRPNPTAIADGPAVELRLTTPRVARNGVFFETRVAIRAKRDIADLAFAVSPGVWRDITINSAIPAADKESYAGGFFRMSYGAVGAGDTLELKFDGQINPPLTGGTRGRVAVFDGPTPLVALPVRMRVWP